MSKVRFDLSQNTFSLLLAKMLYQPFLWIVVSFAIVASALSMTQWHDVIRDSARTRWAIQWYPVVSSGLVEKSIQWTPTDSTAVIEVIQCAVPIGIRKVVWQGSFFSESTLHGSQNLCGVFTFTPNSWVKLALVLKNFIWIAFTPIIVVGASFFRVYPALGFTVFLTALLNMASPRISEDLTIALWMTFAVPLRLGVGFISVQISRIPLILTTLAGRSQSRGIIAFIQMKVFGSRRKFFAANGAAFHLGHEHTPSCLSYLGCGQAAKLTVRAVNYSTLVHVPYYSMNGGRA